MRAGAARLRNGFVTAIVVAAIVAASMVGLDGWADAAATHVGTTSATR